MSQEIIVGIDFGTTFSGVSWAINGGNKTIRIVNDWPNPISTVANSDKVPSKISYQNGSPRNWGYTVGLQEQSLHWFKLLLDSQNEIGKGSDNVSGTIKQLEALGKSPEDATVDFLRLIWQYTKEDIKKIRGDDWADMYTLRAVFTVPAIWSPHAQDKILKIAKRAGLPDNVSLVSEPEAAALAVLREKKEEGELQAGDCFVVCDAGGGTVDLISYKICSINPFQVAECAVGDGGLCGSVYLDQAFEKHIRNIVGEKQWGGLKVKSKQKMMHEFEMSIKRSYAGDEQQFSVDLQGVEDSPDEGIEDETITLRPSMLKNLFDTVIDNILRLIEKQIDDVKTGGSGVKSILLVGGFGTNRYMHKRLSETYHAKGIKVLQNNSGWSSICRGATLWGLEHSLQTPAPNKTVISRIARYSYGLICSQPFEESKHLVSDKFRGKKGDWRADNQMIWFLRRGDSVKVGQHIHKSRSAYISAKSPGNGIHQESSVLYYSTDEKAPTRWNSSVKELCKVEYGIAHSKIVKQLTFTDMKTAKKYREVTVDFWIRPDQSNLLFTVVFKEECVAFTTVKYKDNVL